MKWSRRTGREGLQLMRRDGDCQLMELGAFSGALLRPALVHRYVSTQQQQTRHTRHTAFLPHSAGLYTHTTQHQNRFRAGLRSKTSLKIFFANIFHEINTVLRQYLRAWHAKPTELLGSYFTHIVIADSGCGPVAGVGAGSVPGVAREKVQR